MYAIRVEKISTGKPETDWDFHECRDGLPSKLGGAKDPVLDGANRRIIQAFQPRRMPEVHGDGQPSLIDADREDDDSFAPQPLCIERIFRRRTTDVLWRDVT